MRAHGRLVWLAALPMLVSLGSCRARTESPAASLTLADSVVAAIGGREGWEKARYFSFDFVVANDSAELVRRSHRWDRYTGAYRVSGKDRDGKSFDARFNLNDRRGQVVFAGNALNDTATARWLEEKGYGMFVNDTYWLLMPFKLRDPGVHVTDEGARTDSTGKAWRVLHLAFDPGVGMTSKDQYWVYVDPADHRVGRWDYLLQDDPPGSAPQVAAWTNWRQFGPIWLSTEKPIPSRRLAIRFENVTVSETVPPAALPALQ